MLSFIKRRSWTRAMLSYPPYLTTNVARLFWPHRSKSRSRGILIIGYARGGDMCINSERMKWNSWMAKSKVKGPKLRSLSRLGSVLCSFILSFYASNTLPHEYESNRKDAHGRCRTRSEGLENAPQNHYDKDWGMLKLNKYLHLTIRFVSFELWN